MKLIFLCFALFAANSYSNQLDYSRAEQAIADRNIDLAIQIYKASFQKIAKSETAFRLGVLLHKQPSPKQKKIGIQYIEAAADINHEASIRYLKRIKKLSEITEKSNLLSLKRQSRNEFSDSDYLSRQELVKRQLSIKGENRATLKEIAKNGIQSGIRANIYIDSETSGLEEIYALRDKINLIKPVIDIRVYLITPDWGELSRKHTDLMIRYKHVVMDINGQIAKRDLIRAYPEVVILKEDKRTKVSIHDLQNRLTDYHDSLRR